MLKILFTGGGTAGHVMPNIALIEYFRLRETAKLYYIGSHQGIEKQLIEKVDIPYYSITTGKLRRYFTWRNFLMPFQVMWGILQSCKLCWRLKPNVVFSKGGFVAWPVVIAAWLLRIPIIVHESDVTPGLANRLSFPLANRIFLAFDIKNKLYPHKTVITGLPIRHALLEGKKSQGLYQLGFNEDKPVLLVWGGSLGAISLNNMIQSLLSQLLTTFQIVHLCGKDNLNKDLRLPGYRAFEYLELPQLTHILACSDIVISRAGATAIYELLALHKPHILCPLSTQVSRGEQIRNAQYCEHLGVSTVIYPEHFTAVTLTKTLQECYQNLPQYQAKLAKLQLPEGTQFIYKQLMQFE